jgi:hypothetical protein
MEMASRHEDPSRNILVGTLFITVTSAEPMGTWFIARISAWSLFFLQLILNKIWFP